MKYTFLGGIFLLLFLASCATFRLDPVAQDGVTIKQNRSSSVAVLDGEAIGLEVKAQWGSELKFILKVKNKTGKTLHLDSDTFKLYKGDLDDWKEVRVIPSDEVYSKAEKSLTAGTVLLAIGAVAFSEPTTVRTRDTTTTTVINSGGGNSVILVQTRRRTYVDEGNLGENVAAVGRFAQNGRDQLEVLKNNLFYAVDLDPGMSYDGWVFTEPGKPTTHAIMTGKDKNSYYKLVLPVEGKDYEVVFQKVEN